MVRVPRSRGPEGSQQPHLVEPSRVTPAPAGSAPLPGSAPAFSARQCASSAPSSLSSLLLGPVPPRLRPILPSPTAPSSTLHRLRPGSTPSCLSRALRLALRRRSSPGPAPAPPRLGLILPSRTAPLTLRYLLSPPHFLPGPALAGLLLARGQHGEPRPVQGGRRRGRQAPRTRGVRSVPVERLHEGRCHVCHRHWCSLRPADADTQEVSIPLAVDCAGGCGHRLGGQLWGDTSGDPEVQQSLALPGDRAAPQRCRLRSAQLGETQRGCRRSGERVQEHSPQRLLLPQHGLPYLAQALTAPYGSPQCPLHTRMARSHTPVKTPVTQAQSLHRTSDQKGLSLGWCWPPETWLTS